MSTCCYERRSFAWAPTFFRSRSVGPPFHYRIIRPARPASQAKSPHRAVGGGSFTFVSAILGTGSIRAKPNAWFQAVGRHTQRTSLKPANARDRRRQLAFKEARGTAAKANRGKRQPVGKAAGQHPFGEIAGLRVFRANTGAGKSAQVLTGQGNGDEGNRTLILAMRPPCAPVTPRPQENYGSYCTGYRLDVNCSLSRATKIS